MVMVVLPLLQQRTGRLWADRPLHLHRHVRNTHLTQHRRHRPFDPLGRLGSAVEILGSTAAVAAFFCFFRHFSAANGTVHPGTPICQRFSSLWALASRLVWLLAWHSAMAMASAASSGLMDFSLTPRYFDNGQGYLSRSQIS